MTPYRWTGSNVIVFLIANNGYFGNWGVNGTWGLRPVINLKSDITFSNGNGTLNNPYIVTE